MNKNGVIYFAFGYDYLIMALHSAETVKKTNPDLDVTIVTNIVAEKLEGCLIKELKICDNIIFVDKGAELNRFEKTRAYDYSDYEKTLYLDCDTEVRGDLTPLFLALDYFDIALKMNLPLKKKGVKKIKNKPERKNRIMKNSLDPSILCGWNGGLIVFKKCDAVENFYRDWNNYYIEQGGGLDQPTLHKSIYLNNNLRILTLNLFWNNFHTEYNFMNLNKKGSYYIDQDRVKIFHYNQPKYSKKVIKSMLSIHLKIKDIFNNDTDMKYKEGIADFYIRYKIMGYSIIIILTKNKFLSKIINQILRIIFGKRIKLRRKSVRL